MGWSVRAGFTGYKCNSLISDGPSGTPAHGPSVSGRTRGFRPGGPERDPTSSDRQCAGGERPRASILIPGWAATPACRWPGL